MKTIKIGTRGSKLALYQAHHIAELLKGKGLETEIVIIDTKGDKVLDVAIAKIGSKGVFTAELEDQLAAGTIDIAVHSAKDMQSMLPEGFEIIAFTKREKVNDVIVSHNPLIDYQNPEIPLVLGTSSTRRTATLKHYYPHIQTVEIRGNLQTRISKMERGTCDALILAFAGVHRMGYDQLIRHELSINEFIPAVGQGCIAVEASTELNEVLRTKIKEAAHHEETGFCLMAERSYLKVLEGGCSIPVFALATVEEGRIHIKGGIVSLDGQRKIVHENEGNIGEAEELGQQLAHNVLQSGGLAILQEIKNIL